MPIESPAVAKMTRLMILPPVETPEIPAVEPNLPTIKMSTAPYMAWRMSAPRMGSMKRRSLSGMFPVVKSLFPLSSVVMPIPRVKILFLPS